MRRVRYETGNLIRNSTITFISKIQDEAFPEIYQDTYENASDCETVKQLAKHYYTNLKHFHIVYGEDWYLIYELKHSTIYLYELAKIKAKRGEGAEQLREIMQALRTIVSTGFVVQAFMLENTSYPLYLLFKKRGIIEQVGKEKLCSATGDLSLKKQKKGFNELEQEQFLEDFHRTDEKCLQMHLVRFRQKRK